MGHLGSDGRPFSQADIERLELALVSLLESVLDVEPDQFSASLLRRWHAQLSGGIERMRPGVLREQDITFGSYVGTPPAQIEEAVLDLTRRVQLTLPELAAHAQQVLPQATWVHAELIRIHPFWDGNGRLARTVQA